MARRAVSNSESPNNKHGETLQYNPDFNGPIKNRSCTDIICLLLFIVFLIGWVIVAGVAFHYGDPKKLINATDSLGNICGSPGKFENKSVLVFFDITKCADITSVVAGCNTPQVCVEECPQGNFNRWTDKELVKTRLRDISPKDRNKIICTYDAEQEFLVEDLINSKKCAEYVVKSEPVLGRCVPFISALMEAAKELQKNFEQNSTEILTKASEAISKISEARQIGEQLIEDLKNSWKMMILGLVLAIVISFLWIVLMRWLAWIMLWLSIFLVLGILGIGCWYSFNRYVVMTNSDAEIPDFKLTSFSTYGKQAKTWLILGIVLAIILFILLLLILFLRNRIRLAIALVEESSKAVGSIISSLFFPIITFLLQLIVIAFGVGVSLYIASATFPEYIVTSLPGECKDVCTNYKLWGECQDYKDFNATCISNCPEANCEFLVQTSYLVTGGHIYNIFGLFWGVCLVIGLGQMVLAGAFASWYWTFDKKNVPTFVVSASFYRTIRFHLGSLAFGSLLIAIVKMIRALLEYADRKLKEYTDNAVAKCIMCCLKCCFWCLENFIKFINRNAYIMIAVYGKNFCTSARNAFMLLMRNIIRVVVLDKVTDFLLFLGKLTIVGLVGTLTFLFLSGKFIGSEAIVEKLNFIYFPIAIICLGSYTIASCFFSVYSMAVDTLFLCFLEDCEMNDGSAEKPYRMSKNLMKILGKKNKKFIDPNDSK